MPLPKLGYSCMFVYISNWWDLRDSNSGSFGYEPNAFTNYAKVPFIYCGFHAGPKKVDRLISTFHNIPRGGLVVTTRGLEPSIICVKGICPYLLDDVAIERKERLKNGYRYIFSTHEQHINPCCFFLFNGTDDGT